MNLNIKTSYFTVNVDKDFLYNLVEFSIKKAGNTKKLVGILTEFYKIKRYKKRTFIDNIKKWQNYKTNRQIPLDVFLSLCSFSSLPFMIKGLRLIRARNNLYVNYPVKLNKFFAFISECIRVEGHLTRKKIVLENTNTEIISKFKKDLLNLGLKKRNIKESLHIRIQIPECIDCRDIKIMNLTKNKKVNCFYNRVLNLSLGNKKEIIFSENNFSYNKEMVYRVFWEDNFFDVNFKILYNNKIYVKSTLNDPRYKKACISLRLDIYNKTLVYLLHECFEIPYGNKSRIIRIPKIIKNSPKNILKEVINATLAAESTLTSKSRFISMCSLSNSYLKDFQDILFKFNINSRLNGDILKISGISNFRKIKENFDLIIKTKNKELNKLLKVKVEQSQKGFAKLSYLKSLNELEKATLLQIRNNNGRVGNSFRKYIHELLDEDNIRLLGNSWPRLYTLTKKGKSFLNEGRVELI